MIEVGILIILSIALSVTLSPIIRHWRKMSTGHLVCFGMRIISSYMISFFLFFLLPAAVLYSLIGESILKYVSLDSPYLPRELYIFGVAIVIVISPYSTNSLYRFSAQVFCSAFVSFLLLLLISPLFFPGLDPSSTKTRFLCALLIGSAIAIYPFIVKLLGYIDKQAGKQTTLQ